MKRIVIHTSEPLIFRDGRPFGDAGNVDGGLLNWPLPATVAGMLRHRIGTSRDDCFFDTSDPERRRKNIEAIKTLRVATVLPLWQSVSGGAWEYLFPCPADAVISASPADPDRVNIQSLNFTQTETGWGTDIPWKNWLIPLPPGMEKPPSRLPAFWRQDIFFRWLSGGALESGIHVHDIGFGWPSVEVRLHTAIDLETYTAAREKLFASQGIRLQTPDMSSDGKKAGGRFGIGAAVVNPEAGDDPTGACFLGADRRAAWVENFDVPFPECPDWFAGQRYLRVILLSPGDFGHWAPGWLRPEEGDSETPWREVPGGSGLEARLVSAVIGRWQPMSGWDFERRGPKATRKLVPPGSVYLLELKDPSRSQELAEALWGQTLCLDAGADGFGCVCVGKANLT